MTTYSRLLLCDGNSNLLLADDTSVLLLDVTASVVDPDTSPYRRFYRLDTSADYRLDSRHNYRSR